MQELPTTLVYKKIVEREQVAKAMEVTMLVDAPQMIVVMLKLIKP